MNNLLRQITLQDASIQTSAIGFGCVSLTMHDRKSDAVRLLEQALDLGITHYDVAPLYGFGHAESILGEFLKGRRDKATVATKFGLQPYENLAKSRRLISLARWLAHRSDVVMAMARKYAGQAVQRGVFDPQASALSLEKSLRKLGTDYIDIFLMHECTLEDARREDLLAFLDEQKKGGKIRSYGCATPYSIFQDDAALLPPACSVLQFDSGVTTQHVSKLRNRADKTLITHSVMNGATQLAALARQNPKLRQKYRLTEIDLTNSSTIAGLLLSYAVQSNSEGITLFATTRLEHLIANVRCLTEKRFTTEQLTAFQAFAEDALRPADELKIKLQ
ncbi:MAG TPA: aldo/keto reductase [Phycisphaerae bacterium]|nr:aldo/keto reductase [Phycisphaerae bacterium]